MNPIGVPSSITSANGLLSTNGTGEVTSARGSDAEISLLGQIKFLSNLINKSSSPTRDQLKDQINLINGNLQKNADTATEQAVLDLIECAKNPRINDPKAQAAVIATCDLAVKQLLSRKFPPNPHSHIIVNPQAQRAPNLEKIQDAIRSITLAPGKHGEENPGGLTSKIRAMAEKVSEHRACSTSTKTINTAYNRIGERLRKQLEERLDQYNR